MKEYAVNVKSFTYMDILNNRKYFNELQLECERLVGKTVYLKSVGIDITVEAWYSQDNFENNSKDLILVFTCDNTMNEPEKVLSEVFSRNTCAKI